MPAQPELTAAAARLDEDMWLFLMTKPAPRLIGAVCTSEKPVDRGPGHEAGACTRPVWSDLLCSHCWHERQVFHGQWALFQANPAASKLSGRSIASRPDIFGSAPTFMPDDWA